MDRIARLDTRRDDNAVGELAQLEARSLGIAGRKRFRELLHRIEIDGDSSRMQGDDVSLSCPARRASWRSISASNSAGLALTHASRHLALRDSVDQACGLATRILELAFGRSALARSLLREPRPLLGKASASGLDHGGVLELLAQTPEHRLLDQVKPALAAIAAISRLNRPGAPRHRPAALRAGRDEA